MMLLEAVDIVAKQVYSSEFDKSQVLKFLLV